jgi:hypothetical protein
MRFFRDLIIFTSIGANAQQFDLLALPCPAFSVINVSVPFLVSRLRIFSPISVTPDVAVEFLRTCAATLTQRQ